MSSKKDKLLESAQKFILKGQLDRAINDYEQIVALDPKDIRHRQRLAELFVRANRKEDAIGEYEAIGKYYADNLYFLKAIAVYKQIQKLDPENIKLCLNLALLNEKQGLTGNALAEYSRVYSYYEKMGKRADALSIIESMTAIDPENLNTRLKLAEARFAAGNVDGAYDDFVQLALLLKTRGDESAYGQVCQRVNYLFPEKKGYVLELLAALLQSGAASSVIPELQEITRREQGNLAAWQLLIDALRTSGEREELKATLQKMVRLFPGELSPREGLVQRALDDGDTDGALLLLKMHSPMFFEKGAYEALERLYFSLQELLRDDNRLLLGLKNLYEKSGNATRLAEVVDQLDLLTREKVESVAQFQQEELPQAADEPVCPAESGTPVPEPEWEEEIEIDWSVDGFVEPADTSREDRSEQQLVTSAGDDESWTKPAETEEVNFELELSEDEFVEPAEFDNRTVVTAVTPHAEEEAVDLELELSAEGLAEHASYANLAGLAAGEAPDDAVAVDLELGLYDEGFVEHTAFANQPGLAAGEAPDEEAAVDLELELSEETAADADNDNNSPDVSFSAVRKGLDQQLDKEDTETHYNLGIAFKEMGLYDDAITEFQAAALDPKRKVDCIISQGICCRDKGDYSRAEDIFTKGLSLPGLVSEESASIKYELALLYETAGRDDEALLLYREIHAVNRGFRDTAKKIARFNREEAQEYYDLDLVEPDDEVE